MKIDVLEVSEIIEQNKFKFKQNRRRYLDAEYFLQRLQIMKDSDNKQCKKYVEDLCNYLELELNK